VNEQDLRKNLKYFKVPETSIESIYSKLTLRVFDVYTNILKCMYSTRSSARTNTGSGKRGVKRRTINNIA
jgi:hypothetical protein